MVENTATNDMASALESLEKDGYEVYLYCGNIGYDGYSKITEEVSSSEHKTKCLFILVTNGGDPDYGFRMSRALGHYFPDDLKIFVPSVCKSAGTLVAIGAKKLIISDKGELGPLDIQLNNPDELFETSSGLDIFTAIQVATSQAQIAFRDYLIELKGGAKLSTKLSAEIASSMAAKLVSPLLSQIDPSRLGERQRALNIGMKYGIALNKKFENTTDQSIKSLVHDYPSHSYVIDRKEAQKLFKNVREPNSNELIIDGFLREKFGGALRPYANESEPIILNTIDFKSLMGDTNANEQREKNGKSEKPKSPRNTKKARSAKTSRKKL